MTKLRFEAPPASGQGRAWEYEEVAEQLTARPGEYAVVSENNKSPRGASSLKSRGFDVTIRKSNGLFTVYARYVPEEEVE